MTTEVKERRRPDYWIGTVHIDGDKAWTMKLFGDTFRPVSMPAQKYLESLNGKKPAPSNPQKAPEKLPEGQDDVSKIATKEIIPIFPIHEGILKQPKPRGRPKKQPGEKMSRATAWRREKEKQGVLL